MHPNPLYSRLSSTLRLTAGLGLLFLLAGCGGPKGPELDRETGMIEAPPASPLTSTSVDTKPIPELRDDPMAPPSGMPSLTETTDSTAVDTKTDSKQSADKQVANEQADPESAANKVGKSLIQVPE